jgi:maltoporin
MAAQQAAEKAVLEESDHAGAQYQGAVPSEPTYDLLNEAEVKIAKMQEKLSSFEFHGYFRSGYALNGRGGQQSSLGAAESFGADDAAEASLV